jgi:23S rRNA pseudouridine1911/1915/1917 synthase
MIQIWEQDGVVALCKPAGIPVFPPHADAGGDCLLSRWLAESPEQTETDWPEGFSGGIAHRLDTPTSGQVIAARTLADLRALRASFAGGAFQKRYRLVTARDVPWDTHEVRTPVAHDRRHRGRMVVQRGRATPHRGKWYPAHTCFRRVAALSEGWLWEAVITTGVMHQIRVHAASVGIPLCGDGRYGGGAAPDGQPVPFLLHHLGLQGPDLRPPEVPLPDFWPAPR